MQQSIILYFQNLQNEFNGYFLDCEGNGIRELIINLFIFNISEVPDDI